MARTPAAATSCSAGRGLGSVRSSTAGSLRMARIPATIASRSAGVFRSRSTSGLMSSVAGVDIRSRQDSRGVTTGRCARRSLRAITISRPRISSTCTTAADHAQVGLGHPERRRQVLDPLVVGLRSAPEPRKLEAKLRHLAPVPLANLAVDGVGHRQVAVEPAQTLHRAGELAVRSPLLDESSWIVLSGFSPASSCCRVMHLDGAMY